MNPTPKIRRSWWQIIVFVEEAYLTLTGFLFFILATGRIDTDSSTAAFMGLSYLAVIVALLISGALLIAFGKKKPGVVALAFALGAFALLVLLMPLFAALKKHT
jgi:hypothetical protein